MNKSFETEYKNMIRADLPDLWSKIEEKLDAQEAANKDNVIAFPTAAASEPRTIINDATKSNTIHNGNTIKNDANDYFASYTVKTPEENAPKTAAGTGKKRSGFRWQYFGVAAAAVLFLLVGIPVMNMMRKAGSYSESAQPAAASEGMSAPTASVTSNFEEEMAAEPESAETPREDDETEHRQGEKTVASQGQDSQQGGWFGQHSASSATKEEAQSSTTQMESDAVAAGDSEPNGGREMSASERPASGEAMEEEADYVGPIMLITAKKGTSTRTMERLLANYPLIFLEEDASEGYYRIQLMDGLEAEQLQEVEEMIKEEPYIISVEIMDEGASAVEEPADVMKDEAQLVIRLAVKEGTDEKQLKQMLESMKKELDPVVVLELDTAEESEDEQGVRYNYILNMYGTTTEEQFLDQKDHILRELIQYDFVTVKGIEY